MALGTGSGAKGYRGAVNTSRPGIYTVDTHYIHDNFRTGKHKKGFIAIYVNGSGKHPDGTAKPGPTFAFDWLRQVRRPLDGLAVVRSDGAPLGESVTVGDALHFELHLASPATDAVVEVLAHHTYRPLAINGQPYVQLYRADTDDRLWVGEVALGEGTGTFNPGGYPVVFKASIVGGAIAETYASAYVEVK